MMKVYVSLIAVNVWKKTYVPRTVPPTGSNLHMGWHVVQALIQVPIVAPFWHNPVHRIGKIQGHVWARILVDRQ